ncbi:archaea-specific SMC-related protein [Halorussus marinus]|uniref:archaea-specific SMC-related protein n=1 Tax=Halorussus marinus TaxID=2505976 RepID=UPI0010922650|nr:archaea-specific SMC-related protein [Halorussus marinus]
MNSAKTLSESFRLEAEKIGGIDQTSVKISDGVTVLKGENATNRTSFLQAVMTAMGSDRFSLKGDADHGRVQLTVGDTVVEREFNRRNGVIESTGEGFLDDPEIADLFAFLLEDNEARRAVTQGENLRDLIIRPIDTEEINAKIEQLQDDKQEIDEQLEFIDERERKLVNLEQRKNRLEAEIEEQTEQLEDLQAEIQNADTDLKTGREEKAEVEEKMEKLKELRSQLDNIRFQIETAEETVESLRNEREEKMEARDNLLVDSDGDIAALRNELDGLREEKRQINNQVSELQKVIQFNQDMLDGTDSQIAEVLREDDKEETDSELTDQLLENDESVVCWTCGSQVPRDDIESTLERLQGFRQNKLSARKSLQGNIEEKKERISELERSQRKLEAINKRLSEIEDDLDQKQSEIEDFEESKTEIKEEIEALDKTIEQTQTSSYSKILDLHKQVTTVELEIEQKEDELASVEREIADIEELIADRDEYEEQREQITSQLEELRNRINRIEETAVEEFNAHMEDVLGILEYNNIARIWIERVEREARQGRRKVTENHFELHVVRESNSGQTYEGTVETLSESEREVLGLVFALAGYLVHDLYESVPVMVLDSLEAIDSDRIARLIEYFADYSRFLIVALLPEDADVINIEHSTITQI